MLALSKQAQSSPPISCFPLHLGDIFKGMSVTCGMCWRGMHRKEVDGLPSGWAGQGAGTACVLTQGAQVPPRPALITPGADVPPGPV